MKCFVNCIPNAENGSCPSAANDTTHMTRTRTTDSRPNTKEATVSGRRAMTLNSVLFNYTFRLSDQTNIYHSHASFT